MQSKRYSFSEVFKSGEDASLSLMLPIEVNGAIFPADTIFTKGILYGGIDFYLYKDRDLAVEVEKDSEGGPLKIVGFYKK